MTQNPRGKIRTAVERVDELAIGVLGDRVDGQVAAPQVFLECDRRRRVENEAMIARKEMYLNTLNSMSSDAKG